MALVESIVAFNRLQYEIGYTKWLKEGKPKKKPTEMLEAEKFFIGGGLFYWAGVDGEPILAALRERVEAGKARLRGYHSMADAHRAR